MSDLDHAEFFSLPRSSRWPAQDPWPNPLRGPFPRHLRPGGKLKFAPKVACSAAKTSFFRPKTAAMDRFELQPFVVHVLDLDQRVARGMIHADLRLDLFPDGLGRRQRVVAVAHGEQQHGLSVPMPYFAAKVCGSARPRSAVMTSSSSAALDGITGQMAAVQHQVKIVELFQARFGGVSGSMTVRSGSSISTRMCGSSSAAPSRIFMRGGRRSTIVPSVARIRLDGAFGVIVASPGRGQHEALARLAAHGALHIDQAFVRLQDALHPDTCAWLPGCCWMRSSPPSFSR